MKILRLYTGDDGESHFEDCEIPMETGPLGKFSAAQNTKSVMFLVLNSYYDYHNAPQRQYVIFLDGAVEIEVADGSKRIIQAGEILLAEDTTGHGHITRSLDGAPRRTAFIALE
ncbi:MAG: hypothetical protein RDV48_26855 [Candidatus Eremiobacteraeota bacterium]|nr:hypothetical protein [Candidatus Eremiobacteraeota bacterium]